MNSTSPPSHLRRMAYAGPALIALFVCSGSTAASPSLREPAMREAESRPREDTAGSGYLEEPPVVGQLVTLNSQTAADDDLLDVKLPSAAKLLSEVLDLALMKGAFESETELGREIDKIVGGSDTSPRSFDVDRWANDLARDLAKFRD